jgi:hypothetical protein
MKQNKRRSAIVAVALALVSGFGVRAATASVETGDLLDEYGKIHAALAADTTVGVATAAVELAREVEKSAGSMKNPSSAQAVVSALSRMQGDDIASLREQFKGVSKAFAAYAREAEISGADLYYCPMAKAYWLQRKSENGARNPYYGKAMSKCGAKATSIDG